MPYNSDKSRYCAFHNRWEDCTDIAIVCPECHHVYRDAADVLATERAQWPDLWGGITLDLEMIESCPLCIHDW